MNEEIKLPSLPEGYRWQAINNNAYLVQKTRIGAVLGYSDALNMAWVDTNRNVKVWKHGQQFVIVGTPETIQQAVNMAAALVALGEADE